MKELSIEEKAKRYDEALEKAKNYHKQLLDEDNPEWASEIEKIFPEFKESEDERIRKELIAIYSVGAKVNAKTGDIPDRDIVAWLEKQGEQKPAWNEEDKVLLKLSLENLTELKDRFGEEYGKVGDCINWLKSTKQRYTWKPSDKQMAALSDINCTGCLSYAGQGQELINLYNDLKKLKG